MNPSVPVTTVPELIAYAKVNPGKVNMASGGIGSGNHILGELFKMMTGVNLVHVPHRGAGHALVDLLGGQGQVMFASTSSSISQMSPILKPHRVGLNKRDQVLSPPRHRRIHSRAGRKPMTRFTITLIAALALASPAATQKAERDMTCRGPLRGDGVTYHRVGYCHIDHDPAASKTVLGACEYYKPCVMRARVAPAGAASEGVPQNYTVLKVYSARRGR